MLKLSIALAVCLSALVPAFPACATEDSTGCYWNAQEHGNRAGRSFIALTEDVTIYLQETGDVTPWKS